MRWLTALTLELDDRHAATSIGGLEASDGRVALKRGRDAASQAAAAYPVNKAHTGETLQQGLVKIFLNCGNGL